MYTIPLKIVVLGVLLKFLIVFGSVGSVINPLLEWSALGSIAVGAFGALRQQKLKRFWAYSYMSSIGFVLFGLGLYNGGLGYSSFNAKLYFAVYLITWHAIFYIFYTTRLVSVTGRHSELKFISQLSALRGGSQSRMAKALALALLSLMGLPPALGFFSKLVIYLQVFESGSGLLYLPLLLLLTPILGFGYLRLLISLLFTGRGRLRITTLTGTCGFLSVWKIALILFYMPLLIVFLPLINLVASTISVLDLWQVGDSSSAVLAAASGSAVHWLLFSATWPVV